MNIPPEFTLEQVAALLGEDDSLTDQIRMRQIVSRKDYPAFVAMLYKHLDVCLHDMQRAPDKRHGDSEDRLTEDLVIQLHRIGYKADHGRSSGGSVDLTVQLGSFTWNGEAKKDYKFLDGYNQLTERYRQASGDPNHNAVGMLLYLTKDVDVVDKVAEWKAELASAQLNEYSLLAVVEKNPNAFRTRHRPRWTQVALEIRHMFVPLFHAPNDAASRAKGKRARAKTSAKQSPVAADGAASAG